MCKSPALHQYSSGEGWLPKENGALLPKEERKNIERLHRKTSNIF
jgi:hypothetical protein